MTDVFDQAAKLEQWHRDRALKQAVQQARQATRAPGTKHCQDCGITIPPARLNAMPSATRCIDCQQEHE